MDSESKLLLLDGSNLFWRSYHAMAASKLSSGGHSTAAIHGTIQTVASIVRRYSPSHLLIAFDGGMSRYRRNLFPEYKAARGSGDSTTRTESLWQLRKTERLLHLFGLFYEEQSGVEADDVIATAVRRFHDDVESIVIVSGDKDLRQLVDERVTVLKPALGGKSNVIESEWTPEGVLEHYGVPADKLRDVWALCGDAVDGVPGVRGIGDKTAIKFIQKHGSAALAVLKEKKLEGEGPTVSLTMKLIDLDGTIAACPFTLDDLRWKPTTAEGENARKVREELEGLQLESLISRWGSGSLWRDTQLRHKRLRDVIS